MAYSHISLTQAKTQLANRLADSGKVFWTDSGTYSELGIYLAEALRAWNSMTNFCRDRAVFQTTAGTAFYDVTALAKSGSTFLRGYTIKDSDLVAEIQYHLLEPVTGVSWTGTDMFTLSDIQNALQRRRNQFLLDSGCVISNSQVNAPASPIGRVPLSDSIIDVRRVAWVDAAGNYSNLWREDQFAQNTFSVGANLNPATPSVFMIDAVPEVALQLSPPPSNNGRLDLLTVQTPADLNPVAGVLMNVPDDFCWAVKYGALADLLGREGQANDPLRAQYCEKRYQQGVELARLAVSVMQVFINGVACPLASVADLDSFNVGWQSGQGISGKRDTPGMAGMAGLNLLALAKVPDGVYGVTVDVVRNAIVPSLAADSLQIGREQLDVILDYAQHIAAFKQGGEEFASTSDNLNRMVGLAAIQNERLKESVLYYDALTDRETRETTLRPRRRPVELQEA